MAVDFKSLGKFTQGALVAGGVAIILSFFSAYIRVSGGGQSQNVTNAWDGWGTFGCLLLIVAVAIVAAKAFVPEVLPKEVPWTLAALVISVISALILIIKPFTVDVPSFVGDISVGPGWSGWILIIVLLVFVALVALLFKESGEKIPEINKPKTTPSAGGSATPPAAPTTPPAAPTPPAAGGPTTPAPPAAPTEDTPPAPPAV